MSIQEQHRAVLARKNPSLAQIIASLGGSALWLDASSFSQSDDTDVTTWSDISGNARHVVHTGANGEIAPSFRTGIQNGLPAIQWKGVSGCGLRLASQNLNSWGVGAGISCYFAFKKPSANSGPIAKWDSSGVGTNLFWLQPWHASAGTLFHYGGTSDTDFAVRSLASYPINTGWQIWCAYSSGTTITLYDRTNSVIVTEAAASSPGLASFSGTFFVGIYGTLFEAAESFNGHIGEIIMMAGGHTSLQRASILNSMGSKWGI